MTDRCYVALLVVKPSSNPFLTLSSLLYPYYQFCITFVAKKGFTNFSIILPPQENTGIPISVNMLRPFPNPASGMGNESE